MLLSLRILNSGLSFKCFSNSIDLLIKTYNLVFLCGACGFIGFFVRIWQLFCGAFFVFVYDFIRATKDISSKLLHIIKVAVTRKRITFKLQIWDLITNFGSWLMVVSFNDLFVFTSTADTNKSYKNINKCFHSEIIDKKSKFANLIYKCLRFAVLTSFYERVKPLWLTSEIKTKYHGKARLNSI